MAVLVTGGAGYIGSAFVEQLLAAGEEAVVLDDLSRGHRAAVHPQAAFYEGRTGRPRPRGPDRPRARARRLRPLRRVRLRRRVGHGARALLRQQLHAGPGPLRVAGGGGREAGRLLLDLRHLRRPDRGADPGEPPAVADQPLRLVEALRGAPARELRPRLRPEVRRPALLQRRRRHRALRRGARPRDAPRPARAGGGGGAAAEGERLRRRLRHAGRHRGARLHPHRGPRRGAPPRPRPPAARRGVAVPQPRQRDRLLGARGDRDGPARHRPRRAVRDGTPARGRPAAARRQRDEGPHGARLGAEAALARGDRPLRLGVDAGAPGRLRAVGSHPEERRPTQGRPALRAGRDAPRASEAKTPATQRSA